MPNKCMSEEKPLPVEACPYCGNDEWVPANITPEGIKSDIYFCISCNIFFRLTELKVIHLEVED